MKAGVEGPNKSRDGSSQQVPAQSVKGSPMSETSLRRRTRDLLLKRRMRKPASESDRSEDDEAGTATLSRRGYGSDVDPSSQEEATQFASGKAKMPPNRSASTSRMTPLRKRTAAKIRRSNKREQSDERSNTTSGSDSDTPAVGQKKPKSISTTPPHTPVRVPPSGSSPPLSYRTPERGQGSCSDSAGTPPRNPGSHSMGASPAPSSTSAKSLSLSPGLPASPRIYSKRRELIRQRMQRRRTSKERELTESSGEEDAVNALRLVVKDTRTSLMMMGLGGRLGPPREECEKLVGGHMDGPSETGGVDNREEKRDDTGLPKNYYGANSTTSPPLTSCNVTLADTLTEMTVAKEDKASDTDTSFDPTSAASNADSGRDKVPGTGSLGSLHKVLEDGPSPESEKLKPATQDFSCNQDPTQASPSSDDESIKSQTSTPSGNEEATDDCSHGPVNEAAPQMVTSHSSDGSLDTALNDKEVSNLEGSHNPEGAGAVASWDANKIFFTDESATPKNTSFVNIFDTFSTPLKDNRTRSQHQWQIGNSSVPEEKTEKDQMTSLEAATAALQNRDAVFPKLQPRPPVDFDDPAGWNRVEGAFSPSSQPNPFEMDAQDVDPSGKPSQISFSEEDGLDAVLGEYAGVSSAPPAKVLTETTSSEAQLKDNTAALNQHNESKDSRKQPGMVSPKMMPLLLPPPPPPPRTSPSKKSKRSLKSPKCYSATPDLSPKAGLSPPSEANFAQKQSKEHPDTSKSDGSHSFISDFFHEAEEVAQQITAGATCWDPSERPGNIDDESLKLASCSSDTAVLFDEEDEAGTPSSPVPNGKIHSNKSLSPVSAAMVMQDTKLAEKVDNAISAAATKFEEQVSLSFQDGESPSKQSNLTAGAFSSWKSSDSDRSLEGEPPNNNTLQAGSSSIADSPNEDPPAPVPSDLERRTGGLNSISSTSFGSKSDSSQSKEKQNEQKYIVPTGTPCPFENAVHEKPNILSTILSFIGDPVAVCRIKMTNKFCQNYVSQNEHKLMRDAVRLGGLSMNVRPSFWLWVILQKSANESSALMHPSEALSSAARGKPKELVSLERVGREGKWHSVIERDVARSFGNLPPHKTGARLRTDSIVRALVSWGKNRLMERGVKGCTEPATECNSPSSDSDDVSLTPADTVSDWGGVTPVGSFSQSSVSGCDTALERHYQGKKSKKKQRGRMSQDELALGGNALTEATKASLQDKLSFILHALAAAHSDVGYCQGMDYVVAHLLRILQDTIRWKAANGSLPSVIKLAPPSFYGHEMNAQEFAEVYAEVDRSLVVEEACFRVMDSLFTSYNLRHFYWPELRCLKTCCLVFERLIQIKLPVLADHFEHHELNVGLFALGWFQTLFLYLPSMPSATVCHMWDIWLVERSFKIFFRVGTAILFLSQPILLNHELEGMMSYLNTFPDATLLSPDILIACALQIKVTNKMLMQLEQEVTSDEMV